MELPEQESPEEIFRLLRPDLLAIIADSVRDRLFLLQVEPDEDFRFLCVNEAFLLGTGLNEDQVIGKFLQEVTPSPFHSFVKSKFQEAIRDNTTVIWTEQATTLQGPHEGEVAVSPITDESGKIVQLAGVIRDVTWRKNAEAEGRELTCHLLQLQDEERRRIGRELHDSTAQELAAVGMNLGLVLQRNEGRDATDDALLSDSLAIVDQCNREIRTLAYLLHPPLLEDVGLAAAAREYTVGFSQRSGIQTTLDVSPDLGRLPPLTEQALFRVLQESLGNVHRHSGSPVADIRLWHENGHVTLEIKDQGRGLPPGLLTGEGGKLAKVGVGIAGMRERLRQLGGRFSIESSARGTPVRAMVSEKPGDT